MNTTMPSDRYERLDTARWLAAMAVVLLHCASQGLADEAAHGSFAWTMANLYDAAMRWCVPVFVMISGALLLHPRPAEPLRLFYRKRMTRIVLPLAIWTLFYIIWRAASARIDGDHVPWTVWLGAIAAGKPYYHLWYLYMLVGLYLVTPFVRRAYWAVSERVRLTAVTVVLVLAMIQAAWRDGAEHSGFFLTWFAPFLGYFVLGRLMFDGHVRLRHAALLLAASILGTAVGIYAMSSPSSFQTYFYSNFSVTVPVMSVAVYYLILHGPRLPRLAALVPLTFGIYLIHPAIIDLLMRAGFYQPGSGDAWVIPVLACVVFILSAGIVWLMRQHRMTARLV